MQKDIGMPVGFRESLGVMLIGQVTFVIHLLSVSGGMSSK